MSESGGIISQVSSLGVGGPSTGVAGQLKVYSTIGVNATPGATGTITVGTSYIVGNLTIGSNIIAHATTSTFRFSHDGTTILTVSGTGAVAWTAAANANMTFSVSGTGTCEFLCSVFINGSLRTNPATSHTINGAVGAPGAWTLSNTPFFRNLTAYNVSVTVYVSVTAAAASDPITYGVDSSATPTMDDAVLLPAIAAGTTIVPVHVVVPSGYYLAVNAPNGTTTATAYWSAGPV